MNRNLEHIVRFEAGFDCVAFPCKWGNAACLSGTTVHGRGAMDIRFVVKGTEGAVQFYLETGWYPQEPGNRYAMLPQAQAIPMDLGCHSKKPRYEGDKPTFEECEFTDGPCYYDGSSTAARDPMHALVNGGDKALWAFLDAYYEHVFHGGPYPDPAEYPRPPREVPS